VKILLVDDHKIIRDGLRAILEKHTGMLVAGEAANGHDAIALAQSLHPAVVVMDVTMPGLNGMDATRRIVEAEPDAKVIGLSMNSDRRYVLAMFEAGAVGYLLKNAASDELLQAIDAVTRGQKYVSPAIASVLVESFVHPADLSAGPPAKVLSAREREVLQLLAEGKTSKQIATELGVALSTVESHRRQIMSKLKIHSIAELTKYAIREGLTSVDA